MFVVMIPENEVTWFPLRGYRDMQDVRNKHSTLKTKPGEAI